MMKEFDTEKQAIAWVIEDVDDPCVDNERFAFCYDTKAMKEYTRLMEEGCCGAADVKVLVGGVTAMVGCNYGH